MGDNYIYYKYNKSHNFVYNLFRLYIVISATSLLQGMTYLYNLYLKSLLLYINIVRLRVCLVDCHM